MKHYRILALIGAIIAAVGASPSVWNTFAGTAGYGGFVFSGEAIEAGNLVMLLGAALLFYGFFRWSLFQFENRHRYPEQ